MTTSGPPPQAAALRTLGLTLVASPVIIAAALFFVLPPGDGDGLSLPVALGVLAVVLLGHVAASTIGYRTVPLRPGEDTPAEVQDASLAAFRTGLVLRFVMTEAPFIVAVGLAFVVEQGPWPILLAALVGVPVMAYHVVPGRRAVERTRSALEADGVRSYLEEAFQR